MISSVVDDLYQIAVLIDQLKHDEVQIRTTASKSIKRIASALGPERTREELIPFLTECVDDEDEVIIIIAEQLGELCDSVGGSAYTHTLLAPLEMLISGEESAIRSKAIHSVELVAKSMNDEHILSYFYPFLNKLANKDWFTARASAAALVHIVYPRLTIEKLKLEAFQIFIRLSKDDTPMVRRISAQNLENWTVFAKSLSMQKELVNIFKSFVLDDQDSIRIQVVMITIALSAIISLEARQADIIPAVIEIAKDKSWRVRWSLAHKLHDIMRLNADVTGSTLSSVCINLLNDTEAEVKGAIVSHLSTICKYIKKSTIIESIFPAIQKLVTDPADFVRAFLASEISQIAPILDKDDTIQFILPILLALLRDTNSEVRLNIISGLDFINEVIGIELLGKSLLPAISELAQDSKWRVRLAVIENLPMLAKQLGVVFFNEKLITICMNWLSDTVYSIRKAAIENFKTLTLIFGEEWTINYVLPKINELHDNKSFVQRMTALYALHALLTSKLSIGLITDTILPILANMSNDSVANIRFNVANTMIVIKPIYKKENQLLCKQVSSILSKLVTDIDRDVRFYAEKAIVTLG